MHVVFGDGERARVAEMAVLGKMLRNVEVAAAPEKDIVLLGDFNLPPSKCPWASAGRYRVCRVRFCGCIVVAPIPIAGVLVCVCV